MKKLFLSGIAFALISAGSVFAQNQNWTDMMKDHNANVHDVQNAFNQWYSQQHSDNVNLKNKVSSSKDMDDDGEDDNYVMFKRWEAHELPRTYPSGVRPSAAAIEAQYQSFLAGQSTARVSNTNRVMSASNWSYDGGTKVPSGGGAGRLNRIRINPSNTNDLFACSPSGGLWTSTNGGTSWSCNTDAMMDLATSDIAIDPTNSNVMYLATGDGDGITGGFTTPSTIGVLKSTDGGKTWNPTGLYYTLQNTGPSYETVNELAINPTYHNIVFAACSFGLYVTTNGGISWALVQGGNFKDIAFEPSHPSNFYATTSTGQFYRSTNGGMTLKQITLPSSTGVGRLALAVTPADSNYVYVLGDDNSSFIFLGLWLSTDDGQTFTLQSNSPNLLGFSPTGHDNGGQGWYTLSLAASPTNASEIIVGGVNIWRSTNKGVSWTLNADQTGTGAPYVHADIHHLTYLPNNGTTYFAASDGGLFKTTNSGTNWSDLSNNMGISEQYSIGLSASKSTLWLTGWQDNGTNEANAGTWNESLGGDGMVCFIDNTNNSYFYGETYQGGFNVSSNAGVFYKSIAINTTESAAWVTPWLQDPNASQTLYAGLEDVWKSTNRGSNWTNISLWGSSGVDIISLAVAKSNSNYIYAATYGSLHMTSNGGTSWTNVTSGIPVTSGAISSVTVDTSNPLRVWVTLSGYSATDKVYQSVNGGTSWTNISTGLPNLPANCMAFQGNGIDAMYVGTDMGVYYRDLTNTGGIWVSYNKGLPNVEVADLKIYGPSNILFAATYGRGTWQSATYNPSAVAPVASFQAFPLTICAGNSVSFVDTSANLPTSWSWNFTGGTPSTATVQNPAITYSTPGTYQVQMTATNGAGNNTVTKTSYIKVNPLPPTPTAHQAGSLISCTPTNMKYYQWYKSNQVIPYDTTDQFWAGQTGIYKVSVTDSNGCTAFSGSLVVTVLGVENVAEDNNVKVYPNPTTSNVTVAFNIPQEGNYKLELSNLLGQIVYTDNVHLNGPTSKTLDMASFGKGIYMLSITGDNTKLVKKIIVY